MIISATKTKETFQSTIDIPIDYGWKLVYTELIEKMNVEKAK